MVRRFCVHLLFLACIPSSVVAQHLGVGAGDLRVHVVSTTDRPLGQMMRVRLFSNSSGGSPLLEGYTDSAGEVMFSGVAPGMYHVLVSGQGYEDADSGDVEVDERRLTQRLFVRVRPVAADDGEVVLGAKGSTVDVSMLNAPKKAVQELRKGNDLMKNQEWQKAVEHLQKAVAIDPEFAAAYNNLGVAYSRVGDLAHEREALDQSLRLNDHNAAALVNRAHLALRELDLAGAEGYLTRATAADPQNAQTLVVLAKVQFLCGHYEAALTSTRKVHMLPHRQYAIVHYFAARACEGTNHLQDAAAELRQFLQEEPHGQWSDGARKELGLLEAGSLPRTNQSPQEQAARVR
jgi:tetratricopeptide (TPR) repeat protein